MARVGFNRTAPVQLARRELLANRVGVAVLVVPGQRGGPRADGIPELRQRLSRDDAAADGAAPLGWTLFDGRIMTASAVAGSSYSCRNQLSDPES